MGTAGGIRHAARGRVSEHVPRAQRRRPRRRTARPTGRACIASAAPSATIALTPVDDPSRYGLVRTDGDGRVLGFLEKPAPEEIDTDLINAGAYVLEPAVLDLIEDGRAVSIERETFPSLDRRGPARAGADGLLVGRRHAGELHRGAPRPARRPHPLAAARPDAGRALDRRRRDGLARRRLRGALPRRRAARSSMRVRASAPAARWRADAQIEAARSCCGAVVQERASVGEVARRGGRGVGPRAQIGAGARIGSGAVVGPGVSIPARAPRWPPGERVFPEGAR